MLTARWMFSRSLVISAGRAHGRRAGTDLRNGARREVRVAGILALGREAQEDVLAHFQAAAFDARLQLLLGGAGVSRALERYELPGMLIRQQRLEGVDDEAEIGFARRRERRRHADHDGVGF